MAQLFADEDFPFPVVTLLRSLGHDVTTTAEAGLAGVGTSDADILHEASLQGRAVLTMNRRDFFALHRIDANHAGIIACTRDADSAGLATRIHLTISSTPTLSGQLLRVNRPNPSTP